MGQAAYKGLNPTGATTMHLSPTSTSTSTSPFEGAGKTTKISRPSRMGKVTRRMKIQAAAEFILERLRKGEARTSRDMLRARMKQVFTPKSSIRDEDIHAAREKAVALFEEENKGSSTTTTQVTGGSDLRDAIQMILKDYPETPQSGVYQFLLSLYEVKNIGELLSQQGLMRSDLDAMVKEIRVELFQTWAKPFAAKTEEEHEHLVESRINYMRRNCLQSLKTTGSLTPWSDLTKDCRNLFGTTPHADHVRLARDLAQNDYDLQKLQSQKGTETNAPTVEAPTLTPTTDMPRAVWFRCYRPEGISTRLQEGIDLFKTFKPEDIAVLTSWMGINVSADKASKPPRRVSQMFHNQSSQLTIITAIYLAWCNVGNAPQERLFYRKIYAALSKGKGLGHYVIPVVSYYVASDGTWRVPAPTEVPPTREESQTVEASAPTPAPTVEEPEETPAVETSTEEEPPAPTVEGTSSVQDLLTQILSGQQALASQVVAAQQTQTDQLLAAVETVRDTVVDNITEAREQIQAQNTLLVAISDGLVGITEHLEDLKGKSNRTGQFVEGIVRTVEVNNGLLTSHTTDLESLEEKVGEGRKASFNDESKQILTDLLASLQSLNGAEISASLDGLEERVLSVITKAAAEAQKGGAMTIRELVETGASFKINRK